MLENLRLGYRVIRRVPPSDLELQELLAAREVDREVAELYSEVSAVDIEGPGSRYFRFWSPARTVEIDAAYNVSSGIAGALPIGSDGGGRLIFVRKGEVFCVGYGAIDEDEMLFLAPSLSGFLRQPAALWPWKHDSLDDSVNKA